MEIQYYAIINKDNSGPAFGIGTNKDDAWSNASIYTDFSRETLEEDCKCVTITTNSYNRIINGNPDAVELI